MDIVIILLRLAITLTFLILATFGPYAVRKLSKFIREYTVAHESLKLRVQVIEKQLGITLPEEHQ